MIQDERIRDAVKSCCQLASGGLVQEGDIEKLASVAQAEWSCWKTGVELTCFGVKLLRICELEGRPFYGAPGLYCAVIRAVENLSLQSRVKNCP